MRDLVANVWKGAQAAIDINSKCISTYWQAGELEFGISRHRALFFKVVADFCGLPCRLMRGAAHFCSIDMVLCGKRGRYISVQSTAATLSNIEQQICSVL